MPPLKKNPKRTDVYKSVLSIAKKLKIDPSTYKQNYTKYTTEQWLEVRKKLRKDQVLFVRHKKRRQKNPTLLQNVILNAPEITHSTMRQGALKVHSRAHSVPLAMQLSIAPKTVLKIKRQITHVMSQHLPKRIKQKDNIKRQLSQAIKKRRKVNDGTMYRLHVQDSTGKHISTPVMKDPSKALHHLMHNQIIPKSKAYLVGDFNISKITFSTVKSSLMLGYSRSLKQAHEKWHIVDPKNARTSCVFHSVTTCRNYPKNKVLLDVTDSANSKRAKSASDLKSAVNDRLVAQNLPPISEGGDDSTLQLICNHVKCPIKLYNNLFEEIKHFEPIAYNYDKKHPTKKYFFNGVPLYELQRVGNHCVALLNKKDVEKFTPILSSMP